jgi:hypothetical protein
VLGLATAPWSSEAAADDALAGDVEETASQWPGLQQAADSKPVEILQALRLEFGGFNAQIIEPLLKHAALYQEAGQHESALLFLDAAWQSSRRAFGFYNATLVTLLEAMIYNNLERQDWEAVDNNYAYLETLYTRLYEPSDPRLEEGLRQVSSWHVNAANLNIDNRSTSHLLAARQVFMKRLDSARLLRSPDDPLIEYLQDGLAIAEYNLRAIKRERHAAAYSDVPFAREPLWADSGRSAPR